MLFRRQRSHGAARPGRAGSAAWRDKKYNRSLSQVRSEIQPPVDAPASAGSAGPALKTNVKCPLGKECGHSGGFCRTLHTKELQVGHTYLLTYLLTYLHRYI